VNDAHPFGEHVEILDQEIGELRLSVRAYNALATEGYWNGDKWQARPRLVTVRDLIAKSSVELMREPNFGKRSLQDVRDRLAAHNLYLRDEAPPPPSPRGPPPVFSPLTLSHRLQVIEAKLDLILSKLVPP
jgi:DNA-directed RNA polymerase alpha subunit